MDRLMQLSENQIYNEAILLPDESKISLIEKLLKNTNFIIDSDIARIVSDKHGKKKNKTILDCGHGTVKVAADLTEPMISENNWNMLK